MIRQHYSLRHTTRLAPRNTNFGDQQPLQRALYLFHLRMETDQFSETAWVFGLRRHKVTKILVTPVIIHYHQNPFKLTEHTQSVTGIYRIRHRPKESVTILNNLNDLLQSVGSLRFWYCLLG